MMIKKFLPLLFLFAGFQVNATIIDVPNSTYLGTEGDPLTGAIGVAVDGILYDVTFQDGTCIALFSGCDENSDFAFQTRDAALLASGALRDQVFGGFFASGVYDDDPELVQGISSNEYGAIITPFRAWDTSKGTLADFFGLKNYASDYYGLADSASNNQRLISWDSSGHRYVYAVWVPASVSERSIAPVSEPSIIALFALGIAGFWFPRRRQS
jgi:hypothetical protein